MPLKPSTGYVNVDVLDSKIVEFETLFQDEIRQRVLELFLLARVTAVGIESRQGEVCQVARAAVARVVATHDEQV